MGLFGAIFGGKKPTNLKIEADRIWITAEAKQAGIETDVLSSVGPDTVAVLLIAQFSAELAKLQTLAEGLQTDVPLMAVLASDLNAELAGSLTADPSAVIHLIVGERHPIRSADEQIESFADEIPCRCRLVYHVSLDDPIMKRFAGESVKSILQQLGMSEGEAIESHMVTRRIKQAQKKIEAKSNGNRGATSAEEWLELNCPELK